MDTTPTTEPTQATAGDTVSWLIALPDYPASAGWALSYALLVPSGVVAISSVASGDDHLVEVTAATTAAWPAGSFSWQGYVTHATLGRKTVRSGLLTILPNFATATDGSTMARKLLTAIEAVLQGSADLSQKTIEINGKRIDRHSITELFTVRSRLQQEVQQEEAAARIAAGLGSGNRILVRFS